MKIFNGLNVKQYIGMAIAVIGVILIAYGVYSTREMAAARQEIQKIAKSSNSRVRNAGKQMEDMAGIKKNPGNWVMVFGGILVVFGGGCILFFRDHHKRKH